MPVYQPHVETTDRIFMTTLSEVCLWTRKNWLNHPPVDPHQGIFQGFFNIARMYFSTHWLIISVKKLIGFSNFSWKFYHQSHLRARKTGRPGRLTFENHPDLDQIRHGWGLHSLSVLTNSVTAKSKSCQIRLSRTAELCHCQPAVALSSWFNSELAGCSLYSPSPSLTVTRIAKLRSPNTSVCEALLQRRICTFL